MKATIQRGRLIRIGIPFLAAVVLGVIATFFSLGRPAEAQGDLPAFANMSSLREASAPLAHANDFGGSFSGLPAPPEGRVYLLLSSGDISVTAWPATSRQICFKTSFGSAGCFETFLEPFIWRISDLDRLGVGAPLLVWGLVPDAVVAVSAIVNGSEVKALLENNAALVQLPDSASLPDEINGFRVTFRDGSQRLIPHDTALPTQLQARLRS